MISPPNEAPDRISGAAGAPPPKLTAAQLEYEPRRFGGCRGQGPIHGPGPIYTTNPHLRPSATACVELIYCPDLPAINDAERRLQLSEAEHRARAFSVAIGMSPDGRGELYSFCNLDSFERLLTEPDSIFLPATHKRCLAQYIALDDGWRSEPRTTVPAARHS